MYKQQLQQDIEILHAEQKTTQQMLQQMLQQGAQLQEMQDTLAPIMPWRACIDAKLTAYDVTLADQTTSHTAVQKEVSALAARLDSLAPSVQDVLTQLEVTGDTAKDIRAELADTAKDIRAELAAQEQRLNELTGRIVLAV